MARLLETRAFRPKLKPSFPGRLSGADRTKQRPERNARPAPPAHPPDPVGIPVGGRTESDAYDHHNETAHTITRGS